VKGSSAGHAPSQVKIKKLATNVQNTKRATGEKFIPLKIKVVEEIEKTNKKVTAASNAITPPSLLGIDRRIA